MANSGSRTPLLLSRPFDEEPVSRHHFYGGRIELDSSLFVLGDDDKSATAFSNMAESSLLDVKDTLPLDTLGNEILRHLVKQRRLARPTQPDEGIVRMRIESCSRLTITALRMISR